MKTIDDVEAYLFSLHAKNATHAAKDMTIERMWPLLRHVGDPQEKLRVIHVAGTSGKTSTAYFCSRLLEHYGFKVGLTVSPHIFSITERLQINNRTLEQDTFVHLFEKFLTNFPNADEIDATYFELMVVFVLWAFVELAVEVAVLETGLGGLLDATNVCRLPDKMCVITEIGYDHQEILGDTIEAIAAQKAGIIHAGNTVYMYEKSSDIQSIIKHRIEEVAAHMECIQPDVELKQVQITQYQLHNWTLAYHVARAFAKRNGTLRHLEESDIRATQEYVAGRFQEVKVKGQLFIVDGAHNEQKARMFVDSFKEAFQERNVLSVIAMKRGKDYKKFLQIVHEVSTKAICTEYTAHQDIQIASVGALELKYMADSIGFNTEIRASISDSIRYAQTLKEPIVLVIGSLYSVGEALKALEQI
jgi:dihydrofolate synthase/folylpolyglutamate synthase